MLLLKRNCLIAHSSPGRDSQGKNHFLRMRRSVARAWSTGEGTILRRTHSAYACLLRCGKDRELLEVYDTISLTTDILRPSIHPSSLQWCRAALCRIHAKLSPPAPSRLLSHYIVTQTHTPKQQGPDHRPVSPTSSASQHGAGAFVFALLGREKGKREGRGGWVL
jgi:hypothetical protein